MEEKRKLSGWANYPVQRSGIYQPATQQAMLDKINDATGETFIARGLGRSYGDTALNDGGSVIMQTGFNHFMDFDQENGIVTVEAGVSLKEILEVCIPKGYFLPVTPGTKFVTIGGALANDVHGKNHYADGTISNYVLGFHLATGTGEILYCTKDNNSEVFWATIGGIGLTGVILNVTMKLLPINSTFIETDYVKAANLDQAIDEFEKAKGHYKYSVAWIDCIAKGNSIGRSVLMNGNHSTDSTVMEFNSKMKFTIPVTLPSRTLNMTSVKAFNDLYYIKNGRKKRELVGLESFFYPLDSISKWNRLYGKNGFIQYQVVFPEETCRDGLKEVLVKMSKTGTPSFLGVLKKFGKQNEAYISFPFEGYCLALDIPLNNFRVLEVLKELEAITLRHRGRVYTAKDVLTSPSAFSEMYPRIEEFKKIQRRLDPKGIFSSSMGRRLGIVRDSL